MADERSDRDEEMLTTTRAAALLNVDRHTVARWARLGQIRHARLPGGTLRIPRSEVDRILRQARESGE